MRSVESRFKTAVAGLGVAAALMSAPSAEAATPQPKPDAVLIGAGDIGHCTSKGDDKMAATIEKMLAANPKAVVFTAGDNAYPDGTSRDFTKCFDSSWGRLKNKIKLPAPGNHEYHASDTAEAYFNYFGEAAEGVNGKGYYAKDFGNWRTYVLNGELEGRERRDEEAWLKNDLKKHPDQYKLAIAHRPLFSSGTVHGKGDKHMKKFWDLLIASKKAKLMITGHDHHAEVFAPQTSDGKKDDKGLQQIIIGTGGASLYDTGDAQPNSEFRYNKTPAVLQLDLHKDGTYEGQIISVKEKTIYKFGQ